MTEDEMVAWNYQLNRHEFEQALRVANGQRGLACCMACLAWSHRESDTTEQLN